MTPSKEDMAKEGIIVGVFFVSGGSRCQDVLATVVVCYRSLKGVVALENLMRT